MNATLPTRSVIILALALAAALAPGCTCDRNLYPQYTQDGILMVTKHRCPDKIRDMQGLVTCVEQTSVHRQGYGHKYLAELTDVNNTGTLGGKDRDIAFLWDFIFYAERAGTWQFEFGVDAGLGSGCLIDGKELWFTDYDVWTHHNYAHAIVKERKLGKGWHQVKILGVEGCCDGPWRLRYKDPGMREWQVVSTARLRIKSRPHAR